MSAIECANVFENIDFEKFDWSQDETAMRICIDTNGGCTNQ